jgi:tetratricopeptide (TPR) repeat protein
MAEAIAHPYSQAMAYGSVGLLSVRQGAIHAAIPVLERGVGLCQTANLQIVFVRTAATLGYTYVLAGRITEALPLLEQAMEQTTTMRFIQNQVLWLVYLSEAYLQAGCVDEARTHAERALELSQNHKERGSLAWAFRLLGDIAGDIDAYHKPPNIERPAAHYRQALALAEELGMRPLQAHCHRGHRAVPCHGHDLLAAPDGSGADAGGIGRGREETLREGGNGTCYTGGQGGDHEHAEP